MGGENQLASFSSACRQECANEPLGQHWVKASVNLINNKKTRLLANGVQSRQQMGEPLRAV